MSASTSTIVLITGANSGIGLATAKVISSASKTWHVIMASRSIAKAEEAAREIEASGIQGTLSTLQLDITDDQSIEAAVEQVRSKHGRLDVLINNAGIKSKDNVSLKEDLLQSMTTNLIGPALVTEAFVPLLQKSSNPYVVYVSSRLGSTTIASETAGRPGLYVQAAGYRTSKAALNMLMVQDAVRLKGFKVFAICPGLVRSKLRGETEEDISAGGNAMSADTSGEFILSVIQGMKDDYAGKFLNRDGICPW